MTDSLKDKREYNMDVERALLIFMVIVLHYNNRAMGGALTFAAVGGAIEGFARFSEAFSICAVDAFLILSGYFATSNSDLKRCIRKAVWLLATCSFYRVVGYLIYSLRITHDFSVKSLIGYLIPSNWYVCLFVTVLLLSPFVNKALGLLGTKGRRELVAVMTVVFCIIPSAVTVVEELAGVNLQGLATITFQGDIEGFTIVSFIYCYVLGYFIRHDAEIFDRVPGWNYLAIFFFATCLSAGISYYMEKVWSYSGILTVLQALSLTLAFTKLPLSNDKIGRLFSAIGGCGLGIFVWHTMPLMIFGYWVHFNIDTIGTQGMGHYLLNFSIATLSMYVLSFAWVYICRSIVSMIKKRRARV